MVDTNVSKGSFLRLLMKQKRTVQMKFGGDFFKILNIVVMIMRMFAKLFGDEDDKTAAAESEARSESSDSSEAC